jgi:hypothetical protein
LLLAPPLLATLLLDELLLLLVWLLLDRLSDSLSLPLLSLFAELLALVSSTSSFDSAPDS